MDDFGVKYVEKQHSDHLISILNTQYVISYKWEGKLYLSLDLDWDYNKKHVHLSMLNYVADALKHFQHMHPLRPQYQPYPHTKPIYRAKEKYAADSDTLPILEKYDKRFVQEVNGNFLYYARAVDPTMLTALGYITTQQDNST